MDVWTLWLLESTCPALYDLNESALVQMIAESYESDEILSSIMEVTA